MKCINKLAIISAVVILGTNLCSCSSRGFSIAYKRNFDNSTIRIESIDESQRAESYTVDLCVSDSNKQKLCDSVNIENIGSLGLFNLTDCETVYSYNMFERRDMASLTKVMTALVTLETIEEGKVSLSDRIIVKESAIKDIPTDASSCDLVPGDTITLNQALFALMVASACDVANIIAEHVSGSVEDFVDLMNQRAHEIGATNTHFSNTHGLTAENHYSTVYDQYLIFNKAASYPKFKEIINMHKYLSTYTGPEGEEKNLELYTTNLYFRGNAKMPSNVTVLGGKTGSTNAAGYCLILYVTDAQGNDYIAVILGSERRANLYEEMTNMLNEL